jgi:long-chain acyl-CoA synthetase
VVTAYVVRADKSLTVEELDQFMKDSPKIANFKRPRYYRFVANLPFNATGKKLHFKMKEVAAEDLRNGLLYQV